MDFEKIKEVILNAVDSLAKSLGVEMRVLVLISFLVGYILIFAGRAPHFCSPSGGSWAF